MATKGRLIGALRQREAQMKRTRNSSRNATVMAIASGVIDPILSIPGLAIKTWRDVMTVAQFEKWKEETRPKLLRNPRVARLLAAEARDADLKKFYSKVAREATTGARVRRRAGIRKNPFDAHRNAQLRVRRRVQGIGVQ